MNTRAPTPEEERAITDPIQTDLSAERESADIEDEIRELALALAGACLETKAQDVTIIDLRGRVDFADYFVLATAGSARQVRAIADAVKQCAKHDYDTPPVGVEGTTGGRWVLADFGDVLVHVFDRDMRGFYDLDGLWRDAPRIDPPDVEVDELPEPFFTLS